MDTTEDRVGEKSMKKKTKRIRGVKNNSFLPDDIISNILSRLPAKNVSNSRLVCKLWRDLTLTRDFLDLHFRYSIPMFLVSILSKKGQYFLLDKWWELPARKKLLIHKLNFGSSEVPNSHRNVLFSHAGLVVFVECTFRQFIVCNPMYSKQHVTITLSNEIRSSEILGVFFHPLRKEYCSLWMIQELDDPLSRPKWFKYKILSLGSNPSITTIGNPFSYRVKRPYPSSLFIDKYLYWMLDPENEYSGRYDIMQFDIISEQFRVLPCPVPLDDTKVSRNTTYLLNIDGTLSFLLILPRRITIWRLEDHVGQLWTTANFTFSMEIYQSYGAFRATAIVDGKLALLSNRGRLIVCNLVLGTIYVRKTKYNDSESFRSHQMSLASLTNYSSQIFINQEGEIALIVSEG